MILLCFFFLSSGRATLGVGKIYSPCTTTKQYRVISVKNLQVVINHRDNYPLVTQKRFDYEFFKLAINLIENKEYLTPEWARAAQRALKISHSTIKKYANVGGAYNGYIFSYERLIDMVEDQD